MKESYSKFHKIKIQDETIKDLVTLCNHYVFDRHFPDKAIDVLDISCVKCKTNNYNELKKEVIIDVIEKNYNVKIDITNKAKSLEKSLNEMLLGQEKAIKSICNQIKYIV